MKYNTFFKSIGALALVTSIFLLMVGCLKDGIPKGDREYQLVIVPSATEINVGDSVTFDVLLLDELVNADLFVNANKITGKGYRFLTNGVYDVYATMQGAKNSDTLKIQVGELSGPEKLELGVVGIAENPITGVTDYLFNVTAAGNTISDAEIYVDNERIPEYKYRFNPRTEPYLVFARKDGYLNSDTMQITVTGKRYKLYIRASATDITVGETVTFETGYVAVEPITIEADIYINGTKITGNSHTFQNEGSFTAVAKKENFDDSDPITINVESEAPSGVYVSGYEGTGSSARAKLWEGSASRSTTLGNGYATDIYNFKGWIYVSGYAVNSSNNPTGAMYWEIGDGQIERTNLASGNVIANSIMVEPGDGGVVVAGKSGKDAVYWNWGEMTTLSSGDQDTEATTTDAYYDWNGFYAVGNIVSNGKSTAYIWAYGDGWSLSQEDSYANAILPGIDAYFVAGAVTENSRRRAVYWHTGTLLTLSAPGALYSEAKDIALARNTPLFAGDFMDGSERSYAVVWLNGTMHKLSGSNEHGGANSIAVDKFGTIYVAGWTAASPSANRVATYWVVNSSGTVTQTVKLTDGTKNAEATGIVPPDLTTQ